MTKHIHIHLHRRVADRKAKDAVSPLSQEEINEKHARLRAKYANAPDIYGDYEKWAAGKDKNSLLTITAYVRTTHQNPRVEQLLRDKYMNKVGDCSTKDEVSWIEVRRQMFEQITVGKTYMLNGRKGKVVEKSESGGKNAVGISTGGNPMIKVEWKTDDSYTTAEKNEYYKIEAEHSDLAQKREDLSDKGRSLNAAGIERMKKLEARMKELRAKMNKVGDADTKDESQAYKGYLIVHNPLRDEFVVKKDGFYICTAKDVDAAKREIDKLI